MRFALLITFLLNCLAALTLAQLHDGRKGARLALRAPAPVNATRATLDRIIRTYEWTQYKYQAAACLSSANIYSDCSQVYYGSNIPSIGSVNVQDYRAQRGYQYNYMYSQVTWYGFGRTNYTNLEPKLINITAQAMYFHCLSNTTCAKAYNTTAGIQTALLRLVAQNSAKIKAVLPADNSKTWVPSGGYASITPYFTAFPDPSTEILGLHNAVVMSLQNKTRAQVTALYSLKQRLSGGAMMWESLMNHLALVSLDVYANTTSYQRRDVPPPPPADPVAAATGLVGGTTAFEELSAKRIALLKEIAVLRGQARERISELTMESNYKALGVAMYTFNGVDVGKKRATCSAADKALGFLNQVNNFANSCCGFTSNMRSLLAFDFASSNWVSGPFWKGASSFTGFVFTHVGGAFSFLEAMCNFVPANTPCYPDPNLWVAAGQSGLRVQNLIADALALSAATTSGGLVLAGLAVACDISDIAKDAYANAQKCCGSSGCTSPACIAGSVACTYSGAGC